MKAQRHFECFFNFLGWWQWSLGFHLDCRHPHVDVHVPGGFLRVGWYNPRAPMLRARMLPLSDRCKWRRITRSNTESGA